MMMLQILIICSESLGPKIVQNVSQTCTLLKVLLAHQDVETLTLALGILQVLLNGFKKIACSTYNF